MGPNFREILPILVQNDVRFTVIGGGAAWLTGRPVLPTMSTSSTPVILRISVGWCWPSSLTSPTCGVPRPACRFAGTSGTLKSGLNFTLTTTLGDLDLLGEVAGGGFFEQLLPFTQELESFGVRCRFVTLEKLIQLKRPPPVVPKTWR